jgi:hypothetical protein
MVYVHPGTLSSDPTIGIETRPLENGWHAMSVYPHQIAWENEYIPRLREWAQHIDIHSPPAALYLEPSKINEIDFVIDFGTELQGEFKFEVTTEGRGNIAISYGESIWEAREWNLPTVCHEQRPRKAHFHVTRGTSLFTGELGGFRYVRVRMVDFKEAVSLSEIHVAAIIMYPKAIGSFQCNDEVFQTIWQRSAYTARLCAFPGGFMDGIKRDRLGWYGDARITKDTCDSIYFQPDSSIDMMLTLPIDSWANAIPNYSFDCLSMLVQHIYTFGLDDPKLPAIYARIKEFTAWVFEQNTNVDGLLTRSDDGDYFFGIGFTDWSPQPLGGRFEDLASLQFAFLEMINDAITLAGWFNDDCLEELKKRAEDLKIILMKKFWKKATGFHHTMGMVDKPGKEWKMPTTPDIHYRKSYVEKLSFGPSGPSLQSNARAYFAGLVDAVNEKFVKAVFNDVNIPQIITSYYKYYTLCARAGCGDVAGAFEEAKSYFGKMLIENDSATVWESFEPEVEDINKYSLHAFPKSLCHGWGSGVVGFTRRFILGIIPDAPGYKKVILQPAHLPKFNFTAELPTPSGIITVTKVDGKQIKYRIPADIEATYEDENIDVVRY